MISLFCGRSDFATAVGFYVVSRPFLNLSNKRIAAMDHSVRMRVSFSSELSWGFVHCEWAVPSSFGLISSVILTQMQICLYSRCSRFSLRLSFCFIYSSEVILLSSCSLLFIYVSCCLHCFLSMFIVWLSHGIVLPMDYYTCVINFSRLRIPQTFIQVNSDSIQTKLSCFSFDSNFHSYPQSLCGWISLSHFSVQ